MLLPSYSPRETKITWGGIQFSGEAADFLTITPNANVTDTTVGGGGDRAVSLNPDHTCTVSFTALQTSPIGRKLTAILQEQRRTKTLAVGSFVIEDPSGSLLCYIRDAYIESGPEQSYGSTTGERTWTWNGELVYDQDASGVQYSPAVESSLQAEIQATIGLVFNNN